MALSFFRYGRRSVLQVLSDTWDTLQSLASFGATSQRLTGFDTRRAASRMKRIFSLVRASCLGRESIKLWVLLRVKPISLANFATEHRVALDRCFQRCTNPAHRILCSNAFREFAPEAILGVSAVKKSPLKVA